ncbi:TPA: hypothetical protein ACLUL1_000210 [Neisseria gonorrhoeae]|uniref:hypothetical protein n=1 Tax=Neisseria gonorrhoeae TaxID=485 RepID=UPI0039BDDA0A
MKLVFCEFDRIKLIIKIGGNCECNQTKIQAIKQTSEQILAICETPNTALQAIHLILRHGGAGRIVLASGVSAGYG